MRSMWKQMVADAKQHLRREIGCWLYYDPSTKKYYMGEKKYGPNVSGNQEGTVILGNSLPQNNGVPKSAVAIGACHVHTTLSYESGNSYYKTPGPSPADFNLLNNAPDSSFGIIIDYREQNNPGDPVDSPLSLYYYKKGGHVEKYDFLL